MDPACLDWAWAEFAGDVAAEALYEGPFGLLSAVDKRCEKRRLSAVLAHAPPHDDIRVCLGRFKTALVTRGLPLCGAPTEGSARAPQPLREVCGKGRPHIGQFHLVAAGVHAGVGAGASARTGLAAHQPKLRPGRPRTPAAKQAVRTKKRLAAPRAGLFTHRDLCVQRPLNPTERQTLGRRNLVNTDSVG